ncbi:selection and upkeep of intraepithelial T-cells protein 3-like [Epinephelus fuscoguttatus]|uniref:selection and upkeep of intraepithelial T-cells protein 3-like n=1 Tax=Epinephelus fuscoguttatus TaxID=293821 RepID=UPI0020D16661|nr:selection and upkeep of intraepithelial T-cells protein 3-like [Epinephelus fuscoguttatus]
MARLHIKAPKLPSLCFCLLAVAGIIPAHGSGDVTVVVKEGSDAVLPCSLSTKESISAKLFDWRKAAQKDGKKKEVFFYDAGSHYNNNGRDGQSEQFKGRVSHFPEELKHGNASIIIRNTTVTDSGDYTCDFPRLQPRQTFHIELVVEPILKDRSGENPAATPKPSIRTLNATVGVLLQCEVRSASPEPHLQWQDSAGNKLPAEEPQVSEREGRYYITLNANVTKSDLYRCVVTQEEISHQTHEETFVFIRETVCEDSSSKVAAGWFGGWVLGAVTVVVIRALLVATNSITVNCNRGSRLTENSSSN